MVLVQKQHILLPRTKKEVRLQQFIFQYNAVENGHKTIETAIDGFATLHAFINKASVMLHLPE